ncbi:HPP family-domain-containing protein [Circinella umbellata]|nr:HPP family-domain-containing protein [Circinella umbellata]
MGDYLDKLIRGIEHFLGRRKEPPKKIPLWRTCLWSFLGAFIGVSVLEILFTYTPAFQDQQVPMIAASCGASAVLVYAATEAPLAQPRALMGGNLIASFISVCIHKLLLEINTPEQYVVATRWIGGAFSVSLTVVCMQITKTTHPPSGATALLPFATTEIGNLGWLYIGIMMLSSTLLLVVALLVDNIERRYPVYWWAPVVPASVSPPKNDLENSFASNDSSRETITENSQQLMIFGELVSAEKLHAHEEEALRNIVTRLQTS